MQEKRITNTPKTEMVVSSLPTFNQSNMRRLDVDDSVKMPGSLIHLMHSFPVLYLLEVSIDPTQQAYRYDGESVAV